MRELFNYQELNASLKFFFALFVILVVFLVSLIVGFVILMPIFDIDIFNLESQIQNNINILKSFQLIQSISLFILPPLFIFYFLDKESLNIFKIKQEKKFSIFIFTAFAMFSSIPIISFFGAVNENLVLPDFLSDFENWMKLAEEQSKIMTEKFLKANNFSDLLFNLFIIAVVPAIGEELFFRGVFQKIFTEWSKNIHISIFITAFLFSAFHLQFYGFIPRMLMGLFFGYLFFWSGTIWLPILAHFVNNATITIVYYYHPYSFEQLETLENNIIDWKYLLMSIIIFSYLSFSIYKVRNIKV